MKLRHCIAIGCITALLGLGAFAGVASNQKPVEKVEAYSEIECTKLIIKDTLGWCHRTMWLANFGLADGYSTNDLKTFIRGVYVNEFTDQNWDRQGTTKGYKFYEPSSFVGVDLCAGGDTGTYTFLLPTWVSYCSIQVQNNNNSDNVYCNYLNSLYEYTDNTSSNAGNGNSKEVTIETMRLSGGTVTGAHITVGSAATTTDFPEVTVTKIAKFYDGAEDVSLGTESASVYYNFSPSDPTSFEDYLFAGWYEDAELEDPYSPDMLSANKTLYARYVEGDEEPETTGYYLSGDSAFVTEMGKTGPGWYWKSSTRMDDASDGNLAIYTIIVTQTVVFKSRHYNASNHSSYYVSHTEMSDSASKHGVTFDLEGNYVAPEGVYTLYVFVKDNEDTSSLTLGIPLDAFCTEFMDETGEVCDGAATIESKLLTVWSKVSTLFDCLSEADQGTLVNSSASEVGTNVQRVMARYDVIIKNHPSFTDFMGRKGNANYTYRSVNVFPTGTNDNSSTALAIFASILITFTSAGAFFLLKKKKEL